MSGAARGGSSADRAGNSRYAAEGHHAGLVAGAGGQVKMERAADLLVRARGSPPAGESIAAVEFAGQECHIVVESGNVAGSSDMASSRHSAASRNAAPEAA